MQLPKGSSLYVNGERVWTNPSKMGHAFIKLRKQIREDQIADRMTMRFNVLFHRRRLASKLDDIALGPDDGTVAETPQDIARCMSRQRASF